MNRTQHTMYILYSLFERWFCCCCCRCLVYLRFVRSFLHLMGCNISTLLSYLYYGRYTKLSYCVVVVVAAVVGHFFRSRFAVSVFYTTHSYTLSLYYCCWFFAVCDVDSICFFFFFFFIFQCVLLFLFLSLLLCLTFFPLIVVFLLFFLLYFFIWRFFCSIPRPLSLPLSLSACIYFIIIWNCFEPY